MTPEQTALLALINQLRAEHNLSALEVDEVLTSAASWYAEDMARYNYFNEDHTDREGRTAREVMLDAGYPAKTESGANSLTGQNILWGQATATTAFAAWRNSPPHLAGMVSPNYQAIGIGGPSGVLPQNSKWAVWVCNFGSLAYQPSEPLPALPPTKGLTGAPPHLDQRERRQARREVQRDRLDERREEQRDDRAGTAGGDRGDRGDSASHPRTRDMGDAPVVTGKVKSAEGTTAVQPTGPITPETPFRQTGDTDLSSFRAAIARRFDSNGASPMAPEADAIYRALEPYRLTRMGAAMAWHEVKNFSWFPMATQQFGMPADSYNAWALTGPGPAGMTGRWSVFHSFAEAAAAFGQRVTDANGPYADAETVRDFIMIYAPPWDGNDVDRYLQVICDAMTALPLLGVVGAPGNSDPADSPIDRAGGRFVPIPGSHRALWLPSDLPLDVVLTPVGNNRSGRKMQPTTVTQHETGNAQPGTGALMHSRWQDAGTPGHPDGYIGVHFYVDDTGIIQKIPINEVSIHAGEPANSTSVSVELCVNRDRNAERAERNAAELVAALLNEGLGTGIEGLRKHDDWSPGWSCPAKVKQHWASYRASVAERIAR